MIHILAEVPNKIAIIQFTMALLRVVCLATVFLVAPSASQLRDLVGIQFVGRVVSVVDGDTIDVVLPGEKRPIRIRLEGIDAPERGEPFSDRARDLARVLLFDQQVRLDGRDVDRYGRLVARVISDGRDVSTELVKSGVACHYTFFSNDAVLSAAQADARSQGRGFWAAGSPKPRCATEAGTRVGQGLIPAPSHSEYHGNVGSRVYHAPSCRNYNCKNCTRRFANEADARAAGFRPAGDCLPRR